MGLYRQQNRSLKERRRKAIMDVVEQHPDVKFSSKGLRDMIYTKLGSFTPCTSQVGNLCKGLAVDKFLIRHATKSLSPAYSYQLHPELVGE